MATSVAAGLLKNVPGLSSRLLGAARSERFCNWPQDGWIGHSHLLIITIFLLCWNCLLTVVLFQSAHWRGQQWVAPLVSRQGFHEALRGQDPDVQVTRQEEEHQHPGDHPVSDHDASHLLLMITIPGMLTMTAPSPRRTSRGTSSSPRSSTTPS